MWKTTHLIKSILAYMWHSLILPGILSDHLALSLFQNHSTEAEGDVKGPVEAISSYSSVQMVLEKVLLSLTQVFFQFSKAILVFQLKKKSYKTFHDPSEQEKGTGRKEKLAVFIWLVLMWLQCSCCSGDLRSPFIMTELKGKSQALLCELTLGENI